MTTRMLSHYELVQTLGEGGMGTVYRAVDTRLGRPVAVKLLRADAPIDSDRKKRFVQEARAASGLNHPHIITIYDIGQDDGVDFIAMEYVAGQSLAKLIAHTRLTIEDALEYAVQVADALAAAHGAGIVHRDLKPGNIMVGERRSIKVLDFGLAKLTKPADVGTVDDGASTATDAAREPLTGSGTILGTAAYMSPEQAEGKPADARSDVFSFGSVLYEMLTGRRAFVGDTKMSTLAAILTKEPAPLSETVPDVSRDLERLITRCLRKSPDRRWQSMADVKVALEELRDELKTRTVPGPRGRRLVQRLTPSAIWAFAAVIVAIGAIARSAWWETVPPAGPQPSLVRLTSDVGWTDYPAVSPDGKLLAYSSDRSGDGNLDIWIQQIPDGTPHRLTRHAADDVDPSFSADGSRIAFQSSRPDAGIWVIPTLGGEERLLAEGGFSPRFSPDGMWIAYGVSESSGSRIYVAPAGGGPGTQVAAGFYLARAPVWSPDGRDVLFWGQRDRDAPPEDNVDWYVVPAAGGLPVSTNARRALLRERFEAFRGLPTPDGWSGNRIVFHGHIGDSWNMWQLAMAPRSRQVDERPQRVTFGTTDESAAAVTADGRMVFMSRTSGADIWSLPIDADRGKVRGPLKRVTEDLADDYDPTLSADGEWLAFRSRRAGRFDVVLRSLRTDVETVLTRTPEDDTAVISPDGSKVAYSLQQNGKTPIFVVAASGGTPKQVCDDCGEVEQWSPSGREILFVTASDPSGVGYIRIGGSPQRTWLQHPGYGVFNARISPDELWVSFNARPNSQAPARVFVAGVRNGTIAGEAEWIAVAEDGDAPAWSPDGRLLYFWSNRDGSPCLWAQRLDPVTNRPAGPPMSIEHFHSRGLSWRNLYLGAPDIAVARDTIVFNLGEHTGNIWMTELPRAPD